MKDRAKEKSRSVLPARDATTPQLHVVIETPKGSRNKFAYDQKLNMFRLKKVLPLGMVFPFDFGFIPRTLGDDGDPLDVLVLMDAPAFAGCLVEVRWIGVIEAEQKEKNAWQRNDRLIAVAAESKTHSDVTKLRDLTENVPEEIEHFFTSYHELGKKPFRALARRGPRRAKKLVEKGMQEFQLHTPVATPERDGEIVPYNRHSNSR